MVVPYITAEDGGGDYPILIIPHEIVWRPKITDITSAVGNVPRPDDALTLFVQ